MFFKQKVFVYLLWRIQPFIPSHFTTSSDILFLLSTLSSYRFVESKGLHFITHLLSFFENHIYLFHLLLLSREQKKVCYNYHLNQQLSKGNYILIISTKYVRSILANEV